MFSSRTPCSTERHVYLSSIFPVEAAEDLEDFTLFAWNYFEIIVTRVYASLAYDSEAAKDGICR